MGYLDDLATLTSGQSVSEVLRATAELLSDPDRWCTEAHAVNQYGEKVKVNDSEACAFSLEGAVARVSNPYGLAPSVVLACLDRTVCRFLQLDPPGIYNFHDCGWFNDSFDHQDVLMLLELAQETANEP